jgi:molecular chaperone DnaK
MARDSRTLGRFHLVGIPAAPRGMPQIEVTFDIDANGILNVSAEDKATNKQQQITITSSSGLSEEEINNMVQEAEENTEEDKRRRQEVEVRNQADTLVYNTERTLNENRDKLPEDDIRSVEETLEETKKAMESGNTEEIQQCLERLTQSTHRLAEIMYQQQAHTGQQAETEEADADSSTTSKGKEKGEVVDAEFEDA